MVHYLCAECGPSRSESVLMSYDGRSGDRRTRRGRRFIREQPAGRGEPHAQLTNCN